MIYSAHPKPIRPTDKSLSLRIHHPNRFESAAASTTNHSGDHEETDQFDWELAEQILARIEARLPGRIRHLTVYTTENAVVLAGQCSTFYTKQLAQHAAMGILEYERLINNIDVRVAK